VTPLPALPYRIGYDRWRIVRSALVLLALSTAGGVVVTLVYRGRPSPLGEWLGSRGVGPVPLLFAAIEALALFLVVVAVVTAWRRRDSVVLRAEGIGFQNHCGQFLVEWDNIARLERAPAGYVGIKLRDLARLVETHRGTPEERVRLAALEPYPDYDLILQAEQLSCGVDRFLAWAGALRRAAGG
jgi:hypothetical protein